METNTMTTKGKTRRPDTAQDSRATTTEFEPKTTPGIPPSVTAWMPMFTDREGVTRPVPVLLSAEETLAVLRFGDMDVRFPRAALARYRRLGLRSVRVGKRTWFTLPDVLAFLRERSGSGCD
jgi:hypothetical protein